MCDRDGLSDDRDDSFGDRSRAFSSEVDSGSREENAPKQKLGAPFRFFRNGKALRQQFPGKGSGAATNLIRTEDEVVKLRPGKAVRFPGRASK
jgi:hypothetical protein